MQCPSCKKEVKGNFCTYCGKKLETAPQYTTPKKVKTPAWVKVLNTINWIITIVFIAFFILYLTKKNDIRSFLDHTNLTTFQMILIGIIPFALWIISDIINSLTEK